MKQLESIQSQQKSEQSQLVSQGEQASTSQNVELSSPKLKKISEDNVGDRVTNMDRHPIRGEEGKDGDQGSLETEMLVESTTHNATTAMKRMTQNEIDRVEETTESQKSPVPSHQGKRLYVNSSAKQINKMSEQRLSIEHDKSTKMLIDADSQVGERILNTQDVQRAQDKQVIRQRPLINVDSTVLKLEKSNVTADSIEKLPAMPMELTVAVRRMHETEGETAAFRATVGQTDTSKAINEANEMNEVFPDMEMRGTRISMKIGQGDIDDMSGEESDELSKFQRMSLPQRREYVSRMESMKEGFVTPGMVIDAEID